MQGAPQDPFCQVITRTKNVIKDAQALYKFIIQNKNTQYEIY